MNNTLAIHGGTPINKTAFPAWPSFDKTIVEDIAEIIETGKVNYWTGDKGKQFESSLQSYLGEGYAISTTNGTSALHTAISSLGIGPGDEVICQPYTFIATAFSIMQAGALPVFADVDLSHTLDPESVLENINERTKAILVVHTFGVATDMEAIMQIARKHNLLVIEDCAQALGSKFGNQHLGTIGDAGCYSFCQSKHITTGGEGGAIFVSSEELAWKCRSFRDHGFDVAKRIELLELEQKLPYIHPRLGFNYRMTEVQSAIGIKEMARFEDWNLAQRKKNGKYLSAQLGEHPLVLHPPVDDDIRVNSFWWAPFVLDMQLISCDIKTFAESIAAEGVPSFHVPWPEIYYEEAFTKTQGAGLKNYPFNDPAHRHIDYSQFDCKTARFLGESTLVFPAHPVYCESHMELMFAAFNKAYEYYKK
ncbi:DegT/DnrJ/EryC1/StrS family aminotransferase [Aliikangiella coralliicola]|uniref:DegT/DnrJ/EryC1/StrS family aminotransferase n=1 Tax=Aliikangiella coralliicola TaxID=2592383 RepID=A0A545U0D9_9GAMM|nr:DegT/DnrJ/EryC1/StrS family aminotransferase [Aliikangiella coralliicola]TQV82936.1 DegT/DnrJ/EryC1/StrS family aminotransferase [Aliikangiella coralliicola]